MKGTVDKNGVVLMSANKFQVWVSNLNQCTFSIGHPKMWSTLSYLCFYHYFKVITIHKKDLRNKCRFDHSKENSNEFISFIDKLLSTCIFKISAVSTVKSFCNSKIKTKLSWHTSHFIRMHFDSYFRPWSYSSKSLFT